MLLGLLGSLGGLTGGSCFRAPRWVDLRRPPGTTPQPQSWAAWARATATGRAFVLSPNLTWFLIALAVYRAFPYGPPGGGGGGLADIRDWPAFFRARLAVNAAVCAAYYGFWWAALYGCRPGRCARRKFLGRPVAVDADAAAARVRRTKTAGAGGATAYLVPETPARDPYPSRRTMAHNLWYWALGVLQWTAWETAFVFLYATGRLPYLADADALATWGGVARCALLTVLVPVWRGAHFYFSHRLLHLRPLYRFVHSLHHRNTDVEPFAGLTMHPVEHMFYFACVAPSLYVVGSPFHLLWNGYHLLLSPAASHSGWEDHFQSDQFHFLHHARFECNYGSASMPFDYGFGTHREQLGTSRNYRGQGGAGGAATAAGRPNRMHHNNNITPAADDSKDAGAGPPPRAPVLRRNPRAETKAVSPRDVLPATGLDAVYWLCCAGLAAVLWAALAGGAAMPRPSARGVAGLAAVGPVAAAVLLQQLSGDKLSVRWPFHKERVCGTFGLHLLVGAAVTVLPCFHAVEALLLPPGQSAFHRLWG